MYKAKRRRELAHRASLQNPGQEVKKERLCAKIQEQVRKEGLLDARKAPICVLQESQPDRGLVTEHPSRPRSSSQMALKEAALSHSGLEMSLSDSSSLAGSFQIPR